MTLSVMIKIQDLLNTNWESWSGIMMFSKASFATVNSV